MTTRRNGVGTVDWGRTAVRIYMTAGDSYVERGQSDIGQILKEMRKLSLKKMINWTNGQPRSITEMYTSVWHQKFQVGDNLAVTCEEIVFYENNFLPTSSTPLHEQILNDNKAWLLTYQTGNRMGNKQ